MAKLVAIQGKMGETWCQSFLIWARATPKNRRQKKEEKRQMGQALHATQQQKQQQQQFTTGTAVRVAF